MKHIRTLIKLQQHALEHAQDALAQLKDRLHKSEARIHTLHQHREDEAPSLGQDPMLMPYYQAFCARINHLMDEEVATQKRIEKEMTSLHEEIRTRFMAKKQYEILLTQARMALSKKELKQEIDFLDAISSHAHSYSEH